MKKKHKIKISLTKLRRGLWRSSCCFTPVKSEEGLPDFLGDKEAVTMYCVCSKCGKPCDLADYKPFPKNNQKTDT